MVRYRNELHGRIIERPSEDEWLEASAGWTRIEEVPAPQAPAEQDEGSNE